MQSTQHFSYWLLTTTPAAVCASLTETVLDRIEQGNNQLKSGLENQVIKCEYDELEIVVEAHCSKQALSRVLGLKLQELTHLRAIEATGTPCSRLPVR